MTIETFAVDRRHTRWLMAYVSGGLFVSVLLVYFIGRIPVSGVVMVDVHQSVRLEKILKENGMVLWTGIGKLGWMMVEFRNPLALCTIDDLVLEDARTNNYRCLIRYKCLLPFLNHEILVD